jgi:hypothetical protein
MATTMVGRLRSSSDGCLTSRSRRTASPPLNSSVRPLLGCSAAASASASSRQLSVLRTWPRALQQCGELRAPKAASVAFGGVRARPAQSPKHGAAQAPNSSFKRTAAPPLNSGVMSHENYSASHSPFSCLRCSLVRSCSRRTGGPAVL